MATQEEKDYAIKTLGEIKTPLVGEFMGVNINEFSKNELIKILSIQNKKWLESIGFKYNS